MEMRDLVYQARRSLILAERAAGPQTRLANRAAAIAALNQVMREHGYQPDDWIPLDDFRARFLKAPSGD